MANDLSVVLSDSLTTVQAGLPKNFNIQRFVNNSIALLNGNDALQKFGQDHPKTAMSQIKAGLMQGAYLGLDFINQEAYLVPYGATLQFQTSYKGARKIAKKYSLRPIKDIIADVVREGDVFEVTDDNGEQTYKFQPKPFNNGNIIGAFASCLYEDGGRLVETMSIEELEKVRNASRAKSSGAWTQFTSEMYRKVVIKRLCKRIPIEFETAEQATAYNSDEAIETNTVRIVENEIAESANKIDFAEVTENMGENNK